MDQLINKRRTSSVGDRGKRTHQKRKVLEKLRRISQVCGAQASTALLSLSKGASLKTQGTFDKVSMELQAYEIIDEDVVEKRSAEIQRKQGNGISILTAPGIAKIDFNQNDVEELKDIFRMLPAAVARAFSIEYGWIRPLIYIPVHPTMLKALIQFWNPSIKCFTFGENDLTPTLEEYHCLTNIPMTKENNLFLYSRTERSKKQLAKLMGLREADIEELQVDKEYSVSKMLKFARDNIKHHNGTQMLALLIYCLVLFPKQVGKVDQRVVIYFTKVCRDVKGVNPIIGVLAETFRSLDYCRIRGRGRFVGCAPLLCLWAMSHFRCPRDFRFPELVYQKSYDPCKNYVANFGEVIWPEQRPSKNEWSKFLQKMGTTDIAWLPAWKERYKTIYSCGDYDWVPLLGPWGGTGYAPCLVRRQTGSRQFMPITFGLSQANFTYGDVGTKDKVKKVIGAWKQLKAMVNEGQNEDVSTEYVIWHRERVEEFAHLYQSTDSNDVSRPSGSKEIIESRPIVTDEIDSSDTGAMEKLASGLKRKLASMEQEREIAILEKRAAEQKAKVVILKKNVIDQKMKEVILEKIAAEQGMESAIRERNAAKSEACIAIHEKNVIVGEKDEAIIERDIAVHEKNMAIIERNSILTERDSAILKIISMTSAISEHQDFSREATELLQENANQILELEMDFNFSQQRVFGLWDDLQEQRNQNDLLRERWDSTSDQIKRLVTTLRFAAARARHIAPELARLKDTLVMTNPREAELSNYLDDHLKELRFYGRFQ